MQLLVDQKHRSRITETEPAITGQARGWNLSNHHHHHHHHHLGGAREVGAEAEKGREGRDGGVVVAVERADEAVEIGVEVEMIETEREAVVKNSS
jgi:hypothetical protein